WQFVPGVAACGFLLTALGAAWLPRLEGGWQWRARAALGLGLALAGLLLAFRGVIGEGGAAGLGQFAGWLDGGRVGDFLRQPTASPWTLAGVLAGAMAWGGVHALTPGHGKALVGAYLVGARGTWRHAVWLGLTVAVTHTAGVFLLGGAAVLAADEAGRQRLMPWLALASGLGMCAVGGTMAARGLWRLRGRAGEGRAHSHGGLAHSHGGTPHSHGGVFDAHDEALHSHGVLAHSHGGDPSGPVGWRNLLALGVSGGLVPCPSALALMLAAIALGRPGLGLVLCAAFGLGLAGVLTGVGLLCLAGVRFWGDSGRLGRAAEWLPLIGAGLIAAIGALAAWEALVVLLS
ncbi:MAG TPA: ABC transporter permease, partial [Solidesulfovibrio magneticus]|nr:ABC transporter permease [Solidesulfovibrio magneticus]